MADGNTNIDVLDIEITASSDDAAKKINGLTESLRDLQTVTKQKFGDIFKQIDGIGDSASAAQKKVREKTEALNRATGKTSKPVEFDAAKAVKGIKSFDKEISNTEKNIARLRAKIEALESAKVTTENPSAELMASFDAQISEAKEALKEQSDVLSALQSQQKDLRDSLREGLSAMGEAKAFDQIGEDVDGLADKMQNLSSTAKETAQSLNLKENVRDSLYGDIKERTDAIRDSLKDAKDEFGQFTDFINSSREVDGLEGAKNYAKEIREQFKAATYAAKDAKKDLAQYSSLSQPIGDSQISTFVKAQNAVDALKEKYRELKLEFSELPELPDFSKSNSENLQKAQDTVSEIKKQIEDIGETEIKPPDMKTLQKDLDSLKGSGLDSLKNMLASVELQAVKTDGKIAAMQRTLDGLKDTPGAEAVEQDIQSLIDKAERLKSFIEEFKYGIQVLSNYNPDLSAPGVGDEIKESIEDIKRLKDLYKSANNEVKIAGETAKNSLAALKAEAKDSGEPSDKIGGIERLKEIKKELSKLDFGPIKKLGGAFKNLENAILGAAKSLGRFALALPRKALSGVADGVKAVGRSIADRFTKPFKTALGAFQKWKSAIGRIMFYRAIREAIKAITDGFKTGIENLYQYSRLVGTEFAPAMDRLATSSLYLKNSLGAMAAPLIQALAPAIEFIIDKFVALLNVIGKVFAALTGKSVYTQAKKHAVEYGEAAKDASKATKDFLLGIDELNVLNDNSGGAGGAASDFGNMFEEVEVPNDIKDWTDKIRKAIEEGDWRGAGSILADKLNEVVENWDAYGWGKKLGEKINNALNFAYGFLKEFNFENLGLKVADFFNGIFDTVDWDLAGRVFAAGWNGLMEFIYGLITGFHWDVFGRAIADAIVGFFSEIDWELPIKILRAGIEGVRQALVGFLSELGERLDIHGITDPLIEIVNTVAGTLQRLITDTQIWFSQLDFTPLITSFELLLAAVSPFVSLISEGLLWGYENVLLPLATWTIEEAVPAAVNVLTAAFGLLTAAIERLAPIVKSFIETVVPAAKKVIIDALNGIRDVFEKLTSLIRGDTTFKEFFESLSAGEKIAIALGVAIGGITLALGIAGTAISVFSGIAKSAHAIVEALKLAIEGASLVLSLITSPVGIAVAAIAGLIAVVALCAAHFESFREVVVQVWEGIKTTLSEVASWFMAYVVTPIVDGWNNFIKPVIDSLVKHLGDAITNHIVPLLKTAMQVIGKVAEVVGFVFDKIIGPIVKWVIDVAAPVVGTAIGFVGDVFISLANTIADVSTGILEVFGGVIDFVAGVFTGDWERAWNGVKEIFAGVWDAIAGIIEAPVNFIIRQINRVIEGLNKIQVPDWVPYVGGKGFHLTPIEEFDLPRKGSAYSSRSSYSNNRNYDRNNGKIMYGETGSEFRDRVNSGSYNSELLSSIKDMGKMSDSISELMSGLKSATQAQTESNVGVSESISELLSKIENTNYQTPPQSSLYTPGMASPLASPMGTLSSAYNSNSQGSGGGYDGAAIINAINAQGDRIVNAINSQDYSTSIDGKTLMQSVERAQRQRGANIMGGGVLV